MIDPVIVGVISDTHGLIRPEAVQALQGSQLIVHAGDVGKPQILTALEAVAPVLAVRGNIDTGEWANELPFTRTIEVPGTRLYVIHNLDELNIDPGAAGFQGVISGHSHHPSIEWREGIMYLNPGSAGPRRFNLPVMVAKIEVIGKKLVPELIELKHQNG